MRFHFPSRWGHGHVHLIIVLLSVLVGAVLGMRYMDVSRRNPAVAQSTGALATLQQDFAQVAKSVKPSVVTIVTETVIKGGSTGFPFFNEDWFGRPLPPDLRKFFEAPSPDQKIKGLGSGFVIREDGYILTNNHVVGEAQKLRVILPDDEKRYPAALVGRDERSDLAVMKIERKGLPPVKFGDSDALEVGQWAIAIGSPFGLEQTVTVGVISALGRHPDNGDPRLRYGEFIQTDASINKGNSGGPLVNINGEVVGMNTFIFSETGGNIGIGFAIPGNTAKAVSTELIEKGKVSRGRLGVIIQRLTPEMKAYFGTEAGVVVGDVQPGSPAEKAGVQAGDVIVKFNGKDITSPDQLTAAVSRLGPGKKATLLVVRNKQQLELTAVTGELKEEAQVGAAPPSPAEVPGKGKVLGIAVTSLEEARAQGIRVPTDRAGVFVTEVDPTGAAYSAGLRPGVVILQFNGVSVPSVEAFQQEASKVRPGDNVILRLLDRNGTSLFLGFQAE